MKKGYLISLFVLVVLSLLGLQYYVYDNLDKRQLELSERQELQNELILIKINQTATSIIDLLKEDQLNNEQRSLELEKQILLNFQELESYVDKKTLELESDFNSQILGVDSQIKDLEERDFELENKLDTINVESGDFTSIIQDVMQATVSIKTEDSQGSGFFFDERGYIVTNRHVIDGADTIYAIDSDSKVYQATLVLYANNVDLAVLKIESETDFEYLRFEDDVEVGERVIAVGNPLGYSFTVTEGIISAVDRHIDSSGVGYIQIDVPINPGNSGGPLVNSNKRVVGINTFKSSTGEGIGFSIAAEIIEEVTNIIYES